VRISVKLTLGLAATALVTFGTYARLGLAEEERELRAVKERESSLLARSLQVSFENAMRDGNFEDVHATVDHLKEIERAVDVFVYASGDLEVSSGDESPSQAHRDARAEALASGKLVLRFVPPAAPKAIIAAVPLTGEGDEPLGVLVLDRPVDELHTVLAASRRASVLVVAAIVLSTALVGLALGRLWIGRPLDRLREGMRRVRGGDLATAIPAGSNDEVGALAAEFNSMLAELRQARERLQGEAESRRQLERALQEREKLARVGQLSAGLAHEIGSPLQVLIGRARTLDRRAHDHEAVRKQASIIVQQGERITRIVEQLLRFARRPRGAGPSVGDARRACQAVVDLLEVEARRREVALALEPSHGRSEVLVSEDHVQQIVLNLATNALAATPAGGRVRVSVEAREPEAGREGARAPGEASGGRVRLVVSDTGRGIAEGDLPHVFEPFFTTRDHEGGTGLGLATVRALVLEHGGTIGVESDVGVGTTFVVELPAHDGPGGAP
jgi:signal transduction histidine kinase